MNERTHRRRRWPAALVMAVAALAIGAVVGAPHTGQAAGKAMPVNTGTPTISGTPQENQTLTASDGTWTGSPTSFAYAWSSCDKNGDNCAAISGATAKTYTLKSADVDHTVRVTVTATNGDGSTAATSAPTAVVSNAAAPTVTTAPAISGTVAIGSKLTVSNGSWNGSPSSFAYSWLRCDQAGNNCSTIGGQTGNTYTIGPADAGTTVRAIVTATNGAGSTEVTTAQTGVVPSLAPATGCPSGTGTIAVSSLSAPARLDIGQQTITPGLVTPSAKTVQLHFRVTACGGRPVQGATLFATAIPYNQYTGVTATTGADGTVTLSLGQRSGFPAARRQQLLVILARATKPGESVLGGVSTRRVFSFPVSLH
jgi:hypothetical protein